MQPKQFWTKTLKVVQVLFIIGGAIYSLIAAINSKWWIAPVGWIITFFSAAGVGTIIEISENIAVRLELENLKESDFTADSDDPYAMLRSGSGQQSSENKSNDPYAILGYSSNSSKSGEPVNENSVNPNLAYFKQSTQGVSSKAEKNPVSYEKKDYWVCPDCGEFNDLDVLICKRCDNQVWVCPKCGEGNDFDSTACSKCGWQA